jgi:hypothetical protein
MKMQNEIAVSQPTITEPASSTKPKIDWVNIIEQWKSSGLSQSAFCKTHNINYQQFNYHYSKQNPADKVKPKLLPINMLPNRSSPITNHFMLHYPNGMKLSIPMDADPIVLKTLLTCLERL